MLTSILAITFTLTIFPLKQNIKRCFLYLNSYKLWVGQRVLETGITSTYESKRTKPKTLNCQKTLSDMIKKDNTTSSLS